MEHVDLNGLRPLDRAIECGNIAAIQVFLKKGAKLGPTTWSLSATKPDIMYVNETYCGYIIKYLSPIKIPIFVFTLFPTRLSYFAGLYCLTSCWKMVTRYIVRTDLTRQPIAMVTPFEEYQLTFQITIIQLMIRRRKRKILTISMMTKWEIVII